MALRKSVLITGVNQGLAFAIISVAGTRDPSVYYILAYRSLEAGQEAIARLKEKSIVASLEVTTLYGKLNGKNAWLP